jgi:prolyl-tRNA editing enzyme YbaK/EbsC (Cys-tRNA(Pro) deacylase)
MDTFDHPAVAEVAAALTEAGQHHAAERIRILPTEARTAAQAAEALGVDVGAIANSLVFRAVFPDRVEALLALISGAHRADTGQLGTLIGATEVGMAHPAFVKEHTGQVIGGVAPVGHPVRLITLVDIALRRHDAVWAAAGHAKAVFPTTFDALLTLTGGNAADIANAGQDIHP